MLTEVQGAAVDGQISDFGLSFPVVRLVDDLRAERDTLRAQLADARMCLHAARDVVADALASTRKPT